MSKVLPSWDDIDNIKTISELGKFLADNHYELDNFSMRPTDNVHSYNSRILRKIHMLCMRLKWKLDK